MKLFYSLFLAAALFLDAVKAQTPGPAPDNLAELCDADTISSDVLAFLNCANVCSVASCCGDTCATDLATCMGYMPCVILNTVEPTEPNSDGPVPTAPDNLAELCPADTVATDFVAYAGCVVACLPSTCCSGNCDTDAECAGYAACAVLGDIEDTPFDGVPLVPDGSSSSAPVPPANLDELCAEDTISTDVIAYLGCVNVCLGANCCGDTCASDFATCSLYAPCGILGAVEAPEPNEDGPAVAPPANIAELCAADVAGDFDAYLGCLGACIGGACCEDACSTDFTTCLQYTPCLALDAIDEPPFNIPGGGNFTDDTGGDSTGESPPVPPANLDELCAEATIASDVIAYLGCVNVCIGASCCGDTCASDFATCSLYAPCGILETVEAPEPNEDGPAVAPPANIAELCAADVAGDFDAYLGCLGACIGGACCEDACSTDFTTCLQYTPCLALDAIDEPPFNIPGGGNFTDDTGGDSTGESPPPPPANLEALCDEDTISTDLIAYIQCANVCSVAGCCEGTCADDFAACFPYLPCVTLDAVEVPEPDASGPAVAPPSDLAALCNPTEIATDLGAYVGCLEACLPGYCCEDACSSEFAICIQYAPCLALDAIQDPPFDGIPPPEDGVTDAPADPVNTAPVAPPTVPPTARPTAAPVAAPTPADDSGASSFGLLMSLFFTMAAIVLSE